MPQRLEPLDDYVLIDVEAPVPYSQYRGLRKIVTPTQYEHGPVDRAVIGKVLKRGPACRDVLVQPGSRVIVEKWRGAYLNPSRTLLMVRETDILAVDQ